MHSQKKLLVNCSLVLTLVAAQPSYAIVDKIKGVFTNDKKVTLTAAQELQSLLTVESLLVQISSLQQEVHTMERQINKPELDLRKKLEDAYNRSRIVVERVKKQATEEIAEIKQYINNRKGKISELNKALKMEDDLTKMTTQHQNFIQGYASSLSDYFTKSTPSNKEKLLRDIKDHQKRIGELYKAMYERDAILSNIFDAKDYKEQTRGLNGEILKLSNDIVKAIEDAQKLRQTELFDKKNNNADTLLTDLKDAIKKCNCNSVKDIGTATQKNLVNCKNEKINTIYKKTKLSACLALTPKSNKANVESCINDIR